MSCVHWIKNDGLDTIDSLTCVDYWLDYNYNYNMVGTLFTFIFGGHRGGGLGGLSPEPQPGAPPLSFCMGGDAKVILFIRKNYIFAVLEEVRGAPKSIYL